MAKDSRGSAGGTTTGDVGGTEAQAEISAIATARSERRTTQPSIRAAGLYTASWGEPAHRLLQNCVVGVRVELRFPDLARSLALALRPEHLTQVRGDLRVRAR